MQTEARMDDEDSYDFASNRYTGRDDDDSGSVYELSDAEHGESNSKAKLKKRSGASSVKSRASNGSTQASESRSKEHRPLLSSDENDQSQTRSNVDITNEETQEDALNLIEDFHPPSSSRGIKLPFRQPAESQSGSRFVPQVSSEIKPPRLKGHYNPKYRELLNIDINDASNVSLIDDVTPLRSSQIGSTTWTSSEKEKLFCALPRLGRDNFKGIAAEIGSKTEMEVHEYVLLLQQGASTKGQQDEWLRYTAIPAALEIGEECCELLETFGDALSARQERQEVKLEHEKWGESWLLTTDVNSLFNQRRRQEGGEEAIEQILPAVNLMNLSTWLELSERVFMNSASPTEQDNWTSLAEDGATPAIRATAFEDFHSLLVHMTKKLVSTTLFCTMSREKAMNAQKVKHAEVSLGDVDAAVKILKMSHNSHEFWRKAARRCKLNVIDDEAEDESTMEYDEVEATLCYVRSRSRSRSMSRNPQIRKQLPNQNTNNLPSNSSEESGSANESPGSAGSEFQDQIPLSMSEYDPSHHSREATPSKQALDYEDYINVEEERLDFQDLEASHLEEARLWSMLKHSPPSVIKPEPLDDLVKPRGLKRRLNEDSDWRSYVDYRSEWEEFENPLTDEAFLSNRELRPKRQKRAQHEENRGTRADFVASQDSRTLNTAADDEHHPERADTNLLQSDERDDTSLRIVDRTVSSDAEIESLGVRQMGRGIDLETPSDILSGYSHTFRLSESVEEAVSQRSPKIWDERTNIKKEEDC